MYQYKIPSRVSVWLFLFLFSAGVTTGFGQEICNNGMDDDADGLIDLNDDQDCNCTSAGQIITIGDFENYSQCPTIVTIGTQANGIAFLQDGWEAATLLGTVDLINTCGYLGGGSFTGLVPQPIPSGNGAVGIVTEEFNTSLGGFYAEYIGTCLSTPLVAGQQYNLSFYIGFSSGNTFDSALGVAVNLFGTENCDNLPAPEFGCITEDPGWDLMTSVPAQGTQNNTWLLVEATFTANINAEAVAIGLSCSTTGTQYHYFDLIQITENSTPPIQEDLVTFGNCVDGVTVELPGATGDSFQWYLDGIAIPGATTNPYQITNAEEEGEYQLLVTSGGTCQLSNPLDIQIDENVLDINGFVENVQCFGTATGSIEVFPSSSNLPFTYQWSNGSSSEIITGLQPGLYEVTVVDGNGCTGSQSFEITTPEPFINTLTVVQPGNGSNGSAVITSTGGTPPYTYSWSNGFDGPFADDLPPGFYTVVVTDANGCTEVLEFEIISAFVVTSTSVDATCAESCDGSILLTVEGPVSDYIIAWEDEDVAGFNPEALCAGDYSYTVTNSEGSSFDGAVVISSPPALMVDGSYVDTLCANAPSTDIELSTAGGTAPFIYQWNTGSTNDTLENVSPGIYTVVVTDTVGCTTVDTFTIVGLPAINLDFSVSPVVCNGESNGAIDLTIDNGIAPYTIEWSNGSTLEDISALSDEWYSVSVTDSYGCVTNDSVQVDVDTLLLSPVTQIEIFTCDPDEAGTDTLTLSNQFGCDSIVITTTTLLPADTTFLAATSCDPKEEGTATLTLSNQFGCDSLVVTSTVLVLADTTLIENTSCDPGEVGTLVQNLTGQSGCDSIIITNTTLLPTDTTFLAATSCDSNEVGTATLTLSNQFGCDSLVVISTVLVLADTTLIENTSCDPGEVGTLVQNLTGQSGCDSIIITNTTLLPKDTTFLAATSCDSNEVGTATLTLSNQFGCDSIVITNTNFLNSSFTLVEDTSCDPEDIGTIQRFYIAANGCDSIVQTITSLLPVSDCDLDTDHIYVPNAFSPNGDGVNDLFLIFGDEEVQTINTFQIYSRWGELVFEVVDALPNDPAAAWDGTFNGTLMNNALFVYWAEVRMMDGSLELLKGDVTLVR